MKHSIFILLLSTMCSKEVLGMNSREEELKELNPPLSPLSKTLHTASVIIMFKLLPPPSWTTEYRFGEGCYGFTFGIGLYPRFLRFMNGDLKIGFLFFEHRTWEIIPKGIQLWFLKHEDNSEKYDAGDNLNKVGLVDFATLSLLFPLSLSILSIKYKYVRINMVSLFEGLKCWFIEKQQGAKEYCPKDEMLLFSSFLFTTNGYHQHKLLVNKWIWDIIFFFPRLSIDMSYFLQNDEDEETEKVF